MKKNEIEVGDTYVATVGKRSVEVRVERANPRGGWDATAVGTNKKVRLKTAQQLRRATEVPAERGSGGGEKPKAPRKVARSAVTPTEIPAETTVAAAPAVVEPAVEVEAAVGTAGAADSTPAKAARAMSCLDAAAEVLKAAGRPMRCQEMVAAMAERALWTTEAPTPAATLYSAILREVTRKGDAARFRKTERGHFALAGATAVAEPNA